MNELQALHKIKNSGLPYVIYSDFGTMKINIIIQKDKEINFLNDFEKDRGFVLSPFEKDLRKVLIKGNKFSIKLNNSFRKKVININKLLIKEKNNTDEVEQKDFFLENIKKVQKQIIKGDLEKVIISRIETELLDENFDLIENYIELVLKNKDAFNYLFYHPKIGIWIGSTPEVFLIEENEKILTNSLAGTKKINENWTEKEKEEQKYVTDYIIDIFKKNNLEPNISDLETLNYGDISHLKNTISANKKGDINNIINDLHPTPAVCGISQKKSYDFILKNEKHKRDFYTGFLGYTTPNRKKLYVNLRCMRISLKYAHMYVGCGITKGSELIKEWQETENKLNLLKSVL